MRSILRHIAQVSSGFPRAYLDYVCLDRCFTKSTKQQNEDLSSEDGVKSILTSKVNITIQRLKDEFSKIRGVCKTIVANQLYTRNQ